MKATARRSGPTCRTTVLVLLSGWLLPPAHSAPARPSDLVETTSRHLVSLDVTIVGPREEAATLTASDFELEVGGRVIESFSADSACPPPGGWQEAGPPAAAAPATYLLYFDEAHLTTEGRARSIALAREFVPTLLTNGARALVVSGSARITYYVGPTSDASAFLAGLDRLERDGAQVDTSSAMEERREQQIADVLDRIAAISSHDSIERLNRRNALSEDALLLKQHKKALLQNIRIFRTEETFSARRGIERLGVALDRLAAAPRPRIAFYFGDTLRRNPGDHYYAFLRDNTTGRQLFFTDSEDVMEVKAEHQAFGVDLFFDRVLAAAATRGVRLYAIQAQGLGPSNHRVSDAQSMLVSLARETGGSAFLNGAGAETIVARVSSDTSCAYLLSFDGLDLPEDRLMPVTVRVKRKGLKVSTRGMIAVESKDARLRHERIAALYGQGGSRTDLPVRSAMIPLGYEKGKYDVLAQIGAREIPLEGNGWDVGFTLVHDGEVVQELTDRVIPTGRGALVMEREIDIEPGGLALVGVAQEAATELTASNVYIASWPDPKQQRATVTPIAILQPAQGTFQRKSDIRPSGNLALAQDELVRVAAPIALISVACRSSKEKGALRVERRIEGGAAIVGFAPILLEPGTKACVQVRDLIPPSKLGEGFFRYEVLVRTDDEVLARAERVLHCAP